MCNCLKKTGGAAMMVMPSQPRLAPTLPPARATHDRVTFKYVGHTALTVTGPVTGRRYRFERPGALLAVDRRDHGALAVLSQLRLQQTEGAASLSLRQAA